MTSLTTTTTTTIKLILHPSTQHYTNIILSIFLLIKWFLLFSGLKDYNPFEASEDHDSKAMGGAVPKEKDDAFLGKY